MRILIGSTELTGEDRRERPSDLRINGREIVQEANYLRAVKARMFNRGNQKTTVRFTVTREHDDDITCQEFMLTHYTSLPGSGTATFLLEAEGGAISKLYMANAVLGLVDFWHIGCTSYHTYELAGGQTQEGEVT